MTAITSTRTKTLEYAVPTTAITTKQRPLVIGDWSLFHTLTVTSYCLNKVNFLVLVIGLYCTL